MGPAARVTATDREGAGPSAFPFGNESAIALDVPAGWSCIPPSGRTTDDLVTPTLPANRQ